MIMLTVPGAQAKLAFATQITSVPGAATVALTAFTGSGNWGAMAFSQLAMDSYSVNRWCGHTAT